MEQEIWKDIDWTTGLYQVSNLGRVRSFYGKSSSPRLLHPVASRNGYYNQIISIKHKVKLVSVSRLVASAFLPNPQNLPEVNHKDCDKSNNAVYNLEWCSREYNHNHARINNRIGKGLYNYGEKGGRSKLTYKLVEEIRNKYIPYKYGTVQLSKEYHVHSSTIQHIISNKTWIISAKQSISN